MATVDDLEQRVQRLEDELDRLKRQVTVAADTAEWIDRVSGSMESIREFDDVVRLGAEFRRSQVDSYNVPSVSDESP